MLTRDRRTLRRSYISLPFLDHDYKRFPYDPLPTSLSCCQVPSVVRCQTRCVIVMYMHDYDFSVRYTSNGSKPDRCGISCTDRLCQSGDIEGVYKSVGIGSLLYHLSESDSSFLLWGLGFSSFSLSTCVDSGDTRRYASD
jgi:hypothetical protein